MVRMAARATAASPAGTRNATNTQSNRSGSPFRVQIKAHAEIVFDENVCGMHVATRESKVDRARCRELRHRSNPLIVSVQQCNPMSGKSFNKFALRPRDVIKPTHEFRMGQFNRRHDCNRWLRDRA
jgi:hypothetical protein